METPDCFDFGIFGGYADVDVYDATSSCGELARFDHKKVCLTHIHLFINIINATPHLQHRIFVPHHYVKMFAPTLFEKCLSPRDKKLFARPPLL